jgi:hypothetical protein
VKVTTTASASIPQRRHQRHASRAFRPPPENNALALSAGSQTELNALLPADQRLLGTGDYRDQETEGWEFELQANVTRKLDAARHLLDESLGVRALLPPGATLSGKAQAAAKARGSIRGRPRR